MNKTFFNNRTTRLLATAVLTTLGVIFILPRSMAKPIVQTGTLVPDNLRTDPYMMITEDSNEEDAFGILNYWDSDMVVNLAEDFAGINVATHNQGGITRALGVWGGKKPVILRGGITIPITATALGGTKISQAFGIRNCRLEDAVLISVVAKGGDTKEHGGSTDDTKTLDYVEAVGVYNSRVGKGAFIRAIATGITAKGAKKKNTSAIGVTSDNRNNATVLMGDVDVSVQSQAGIKGTYFEGLSLYARDTGLNDLSAPGFTHRVEGDVGAMDSGKNYLTLDTPESYLLGNIINAGTAANFVSISKGGMWLPVYDNRYGTDCVDKMDEVINEATNKVAEREVSQRDEIALGKGGIIDLTWDGWQQDKYDVTRGYRSGANQGFRNLHIGKLTGSGGILRVDADLAHNRADTLVVGAHSTAQQLQIQVNYDNFYDKLADEGEVTGKALVVEDKSQGQTLRVSGGSSEYNERTYNVTVAQDPEEKQKWHIVKLQDATFEEKPQPKTAMEPKSRPQITENTKQAGDSRTNVNSIWFIETDSLRQRLGDLRHIDRAHGENLWAKLGGGSQNIGQGRDTALHYKQFQIGYDKEFDQAAGKLYRGIMVSRIDGSSSYERGNGHTNSTVAGLYQTWLGDRGHYYDLVLKWGKITSDYNVTDVSKHYSTGDFNMWATTLSGEYGYRQIFMQGSYLETQIGLILGQVGSARYTTSKQMPVYLDATRHGITRLGMRIGKELGGNCSTGHGNVYFQTNYYHDFAGGGNVTTGAVHYRTAYPKNWWEVGVGGHVQVSSKCYLYATVDKLFGDIKSNINYRLGARWSL